jgi:hypothetical protein
VGLGGVVISWQRAPRSSRHGSSPRESSQVISRRAEPDKLAQPLQALICAFYENICLCIGQDADLCACEMPLMYRRLAQTPYKSFLIAGRSTWPNRLKAVQ